MLLPVSEILTTGGTQTRVRIDPATVHRYVEKAERGEQPGVDGKPPLVVVADKHHRVWLADGFHRLEAWKKLGRKEIWCEMRQGSKLDALLYACAANEDHGLPRSNADKRNIVRMVLSIREWRGRSDNWIAAVCRVNNHLVGDVRRRMEEEGHLDASAARMGRDGRQLDTKNIGRKLPANDATGLMLAPPSTPDSAAPSEAASSDREEGLDERQQQGSEPSVDDDDEEHGPSFPAILEALSVATVAEALTKITTMGQQMRRLERKVKEVEQERDMLLDSTMIGQVLDAAEVTTLSEVVGAIRAMKRASK